MHGDSEHSTGPAGGASSLAREVSERMRRTGGGVTHAEIRAIRESLTPEQLERIRAKQQWEGCSIIGVLRDWPSLFDASSDPPGGRQ